MKTAAAIIEKWKLPIFTKHLRDAGYSYDTAPGFTEDTLTLKIAYEGLEEIKKVIEAAQKECAGTKKGGAA